ncbi:MAG: 1-acyl-sn-glycerol-3-phosphate acyltransferase [Bacteroidales bacterium]|nr:1-acyl-sn-glycerol-3-phosphate acyltransferase [Bacteroidales bacterium]MBP3254738.1 1-acyl-sn-glycerol-3-phosphate acyltransferase [Bacteroidales bacterium]
MRTLGRLILKAGGFHLHSDFSEEMKNAVIIEAPHTSMWDFVWGRAGLWALGINSRFLIKKELFFFPLGAILKMLGAVPVDRGHDGRGFFTDIVRRLQTDKNFSVIITPEGTRKRTDNWKRGFYYIAQQSNRPVFMAWIDYEKKTCGVNKQDKLVPSGDFKKDFLIIENFYKNVRAKHPEKFNLSKEYLKQ